MIYPCATSTLLRVLINAFVMHDTLAFKIELTKVKCAITTIPLKTNTYACLLISWLDHTCPNYLNVCGTKQAWIWVKVGCFKGNAWLVLGKRGDLIDWMQC
jgi:hypothetical protein